MNGFLIPANSKKSMLIFNLFNVTDLIIFGIGLGVSTILCLTLPITKLVFAIIALLPGGICGFLVLPVPNYHNIRTFLGSMYVFLTSRQKFIWKGWCVSNGEETDKK